MNFQLLLAHNEGAPIISGPTVVLGGLLILFIFLLIYLIPALIAWIRGHEQKVNITILTVLLGWTIIGWLIALNWSLTFDVQEKE